MSNRIRFLFHCKSEGPIAHIGPRALEAMEGLLKRYPLNEGNPMTSNASPGQVWVTRKEWQNRGRPPILNEMVGPNERGFLARMYLVEGNAGPTKAPITEPTPEKMPEFPSLIKKAEWLWKSLPANIRDISFLIITREARHSPWKRSDCHPAKYGWRTAKPVSVAKTVPLQVQFPSETVATMPALAPEGPPNPGGILGISYDELIGYHSKGLSAAEIIVNAKAALQPEPNPFLAGAQGQAGQGSTGPGYIKASPKKAKSYYVVKKKPKFVEDDEFEEAVSDGPSVVKKKDKKAGPPSPRLKIGVWA